MTHLLALLVLQDAPWFSSNDAGLIGGLGGATIGVVCGVFGAVCGAFVRRGTHRGFVLGFSWSVVALALTSVAIGLFALATSQPYHVWFVFVLLGAVPAFVMGGLIPSFRRAYDEAEQRRLDADALRNS